MQQTVTAPISDWRLHDDTTLEVLCLSHVDSLESKVVYPWTSHNCRYDLTVGEETVFSE